MMGTFVFLMWLLPGVPATFNATLKCNTRHNLRRRK